MRKSILVASLLALLASCQMNNQSTNMQPPPPCSEDGDVDSEGKCSPDGGSSYEPSSAMDDGDDEMSGSFETQPEERVFAEPSPLEPVSEEKTEVIPSVVETISAPASTTSAVESTPELDILSTLFSIDVEKIEETPVTLEQSVSVEN